MRQLQNIIFGWIMILMPWAATVPEDLLIQPKRFFHKYISWNLIFEKNVKLFFFFFSPEWESHIFEGVYLSRYFLHKWKQTPPPHHHHQTSSWNNWFAWKYRVSVCFCTLNAMRRPVIIIISSSALLSLSHILCK